MSKHSLSETNSSFSGKSDAPKHPKLGGEETDMTEAEATKKALDNKDYATLQQICKARFDRFEQARLAEQIASGKTVEQVREEERKIRKRLERSQRKLDAELREEQRPRIARQEAEARERARSEVKETEQERVERLGGPEAVAALDKGLGDLNAQYDELKKHRDGLLEVLFGGDKGNAAGFTPFTYKKKLPNKSSAEDQLLFGRLAIREMENEIETLAQMGLPM